MAKFRKKPVVIEAIQWDTTNFDEVGRFAKDVSWDTSDQQLYVNTLEGCFKVLDGDYIIKGVKGEFYSCREDIFKETYEPAE